MRRTAVIVLGVALVVCCLASAVAALAYFFFVPTTEAKPLVLINAPRYGERIGVGELVSIHTIARDEAKVTRVELWVDGELQEAEATNLAEGISPFPLLAQWRPLSPGRHTLTVRAFNTQDVRAHASLDVEAIELSDRDGDGVSDDVDLCPDHRGSQAADGCPDRDGDGIRDTADACPDEAGLLEGVGCPAPGGGDRDGDGVRDVADACPDQAGAPLSEGCPDADWDGVADAEDACPAEPSRGDDGCPVPGDSDADGVLDADDDCPEERGLPEHGGCPDFDDDGVRDGDDACREDPGIPRLGGCPDWDGDGVADDDDLRPEEPGLPEDHGVPDTGGPDSDDDGIADFVDLCDGEEGLPEHVGCPPPGGAEDADGDGIADDQELPEAPLGMARALPFLQAMGRGGAVPLELRRLQLEVLTFEVSGDYDHVICYLLNYHHQNPVTGELPIEAYGPYVLEGRRFDIAEYLCGTNSFFFQWDNVYPLPVYVECLGYIGTLPPVALGVVSQGHPETDWGRDLVHTPRSVGGDEGQWFEVGYRICGVFCQSVTLNPPNITHFVVGGDTGVAWQWEGDERMIDGFRVYVDGLRMGEAPAEARGVHVPFEPGCERTYDVHMTAFRRHPGGDESPPSSTAALRGIECPRTVRVTFQNIHTYGLPEDDFRDRVGPLTGYFLANGARLWFDFADHTTPPSPLWGSVGGWWLRANRDYEIAYRFRLCNEWSEGGNYVCPEVNFVDIPLGPYDDLSLRAVIEEWDYSDYGYPVTTIFDGELRLRAHEIDVGAYTIEDTRRILDVTVVLGVWDN